MEYRHNHRRAALQLDALIMAVWVLLLVICGIVGLLKLASGMD